jgi:hypothetical protein
MKKFFLSASLFALIAVASVAAQTTVTTTRTQAVQNPDGSWTVVEYPVDKEVMVTLAPGTTIAGAKGMAHIMRSANGTKVMLDLNGITGDTTNVYAYAIDPSGSPTLLGPVTIANGVGKAEFTTPMNRFMLVLSPNNTLTTFDNSTAWVFRSEAPGGYAIVPRVQTSSTTSVARAEAITTAYDVPLLNVPNFKDDTEVRINFGGDLKGLDGKAYLKNEGGKTTVKMRFGDLKKVPGNKRFVLWAAAPDGTYTKLGQIVNAGPRDEAEIRSETALKDFGLFMTVEDADVTVPTSRVYSVFSVPARNP